MGGDEPDVRKVYIEPTNRCNLHCGTCIRNSWSSGSSELPIASITRLAGEMASLPSLKSVVLGGFGEPLCHPDIVRIVSVLAMAGIRVELISNASLLDGEMGRRLMDAGLARLWVSVDGASMEQYEKIRKGARHDEVIANLLRLSELRAGSRCAMELGLSFVMMKSNVHELPAVVGLARQLGAVELKVTNVLPYTPEMVGEVLYYDLNSLLPKFAEERGLAIDWPERLLDGGLEDQPSEGKKGCCTFVREGAVVVGADGRLAPCLALLYANRTYLHGYERAIQPKAYGNIHSESLAAIWNKPAYREFRERVRRFAFSPCTVCGGCEKLERNEEDCFGNPFPVCGGCYWAQGVIQCP